MYCIVAYDTPSHRRRRKLMNLLKDHLAHVQESVFEGRLAPGLFQELLEKIRGLVEPAQDGVRIYRMPPASWNATTVIGLPPLAMDKPVIIVTAAPQAGEGAAGPPSPGPGSAPDMRGGAPRDR